MVTRPNLFGPGQVSPDGALAKHLIDYLNAIAASTTDTGLAASITAITSRVTVLEGEELSLIGFNGINIYGSAAAGYEIHGDGFGPIAAQVFGS